MCLIEGDFVGKERNFDVIKMHGTTINKVVYVRFKSIQYSVKTFGPQEINA